MVRPTRHRLVIAMGVATGLLALLLVMLDDFVPFGQRANESSAFPDQVLRVLIKHDEAEPSLEPKTANLLIPPVSREDGSETEMVAVSREAPGIAPSESLSVQRSTIDWNKAIAESVAASESEKRKQEEVRESMWRQTRSVMFRPANEFVPIEPEPVIAGLRFKPEIHVAGLGFTVGSCFIGLPLVGVPVEERTVAIRLFVCADGTG